MAQSGHIEALSRLSALCRYCCKSPKLPGDNFPAIRRSDRRPPIHVVSITLPRSPVSLSSGDEVPHIFTRKSRLQPGEFLVTSAKRLLQQYLPEPDSCSGCEAILSALALHRFVREPLELGRKWMSKAHLTLRHDQACGILFWRNPPLRACASAPKELASRLLMVEGRRLKDQRSREPGLAVLRKRESVSTYRELTGWSSSARSCPARATSGRPEASFE